MAGSECDPVKYGTESETKLKTESETKPTERKMIASSSKPAAARLFATVAAVFAVALAVATTGAAAQSEAAVPHNATVSRHLATAPGYVAACYAPFHNREYPLFGGSPNIEALRAAIDNDFRVMSQHITHVRTYYAQHFGIEVAPIAAKYGMKLYIGAFFTYESWWSSEVTAVVNAVTKYPGTVEAVLVGNENLYTGTTSGEILNKINEIKSRLGGSAGSVKYGTVQRITEYVDSKYDGQIWSLANNLDILGVNIYPFFSSSYSSGNPAALLDAQWNQVANKYPREKLRLTETGFPTAGAPSSMSPNIQPNVWNSVTYYEGLVNWNPSGYAGMPKFWFQAFDRRSDDPVRPDFELYFGFFTASRNYKHALVEAAKNNHGSTVTLLLSSGADADARDRSGKTALMHAAASGPSEIIELLLDGGAEINATESSGKGDGWPVSFFAACRGKREALSLLIARGTDLTLKSSKGESLLSATAARGHVNCVM
ncbi:hypothetical protein PybrP1_005436, partial [[Pythium] brassicae (nom. inval.)]